MPFWLAKRWHYPKVLIVFFIAELCMTIPALVMFALADPDAYRTRLWWDGYRNGFNSSPKTALYAAANYEPVHIPLVWSSFITSFNVVISVLSMFVLLVKGIMFIMTIWWPLLSLIAHGGIAALWAYSTYAQTSSDMTDPKRPQPGAPWYITHGCDVVFYPANTGFCRQAKACFGITVVMLAIFSANTVFAAASVWPSAAERAERRKDRDEDEEDDYDEFDPDIGVTVASARGKGDSSDDNSIEMDQMRADSKVHTTRAAQWQGKALPMPPTHDGVSAVTPRTTAFTRLGGR